MSQSAKNPIQAFWRARLYPNAWDVAAVLLVFGLISMLAWNAHQMTAPYHLGEVIPVSPDLRKLPGYALRTVSRMFIAMIFSLLFTFIFGTWAAKNLRARRFIIPVIDICQSIPVLGFLSVAIASFIALFPGSLLGAECAAIFAIWRWVFIRLYARFLPNCVKWLTCFICLPGSASGGLMFLFHCRVFYGTACCRCRQAGFLL
jgi:ABC-type proline/glycine betaine transport system permease subunit